MRGIRERSGIHPKDMDATTFSLLMWEAYIEEEPQRAKRKHGSVRRIFELDGTCVYTMWVKCSYCGVGFATAEFSSLDELQAAYGVTK